MAAKVDFWRGTKEELNARKENSGFNDGDLLFSIDNNNGINTIEQATLIDNTLEYIPYGSSYDGSDALKTNSVKLRVNLEDNEGVTLQPGNNAPGVRGVLPIEHGGTGSNDTNISNGDFLVGVAASQGPNGENIPAHYEKMASDDVANMLMSDKYLDKVGLKNDQEESVISVAWNNNNGLVLENNSSSNDVGYTVKQTNLDLTQQDNAVTSQDGFMADGFTVVDKNNNIASRFENFAEDNGDNGFKIYSMQYLPNGKSVYSGRDYKTIYVDGDKPYTESEEVNEGINQYGVKIKVPKESYIPVQWDESSININQIDGSVTLDNSPRATWEFFPNWYLETSPILLEGNYYLHSDNWDTSLANNGLDSGSHVTQGLVFRDKKKANGGMLTWTAHDDGTITSVLGNSANGSVRGVEISSGGKTSSVGNVLVRNAYLTTNHHLYLDSNTFVPGSVSTDDGNIHISDAVVAFNDANGKQCGAVQPRNYADNVSGLQFYSRRHYTPTEGETSQGITDPYITNGVVLKLDSNRNGIVTLTHPQAWRDAIMGVEEVSNTTTMNGNSYTVKWALIKYGNGYVDCRANANIGKVAFLPNPWRPSGATDETWYSSEYQYTIPLLAKNRMYVGGNIRLPGRPVTMKIEDFSTNVSVANSNYVKFTVQCEAYGGTAEDDARVYINCLVIV